MTIQEKSESDNFTSTMQKPAMKTGGLLQNDNATSIGAQSVLKGGFVLSEADQNQQDEIGNV